MGLNEEMARASLRFGLGRFSTAEEIEFAIDVVAGAVDRLRAHSAAWAVRDRSRAFDPAMGRI
jgi:cysteine desulfurase